MPSRGAGVPMAVDLEDKEGTECCSELRPVTFQAKTVVSWNPSGC